MVTNKRKIIILVLGFGGAVYMFGSWMLKGNVEDMQSVPEGKTLLVKCAASDCEASYEMNLKEYYRQIDLKMATTSVPPIDCTKCGKPSIYKAKKCGNCNEAYFTVRDKCPKCGMI
ncbi:MAG: hypothetical protein ACYSUX_15235 [Planctomycetota bacterium]|jgi:predicted RNA-binding Zn-ribbon protein involved in translation (DUF1610 family)